LLIEASADFFCSASWASALPSRVGSINQCASSKRGVASGLSAITFRGDSYTVRTIDPHKEDLRLYWKDDQGQLLHDFNSLEKFTKANGEHLIFATNAGMFTPDSKPVGLFVENGVEQIPLNLQEGDGNFYLKPNGIFLINAKHEAMAIESSTYPTLLSPVV